MTSPLILIVDDQPDVAAMLAQLLQAAEFRARTAASGREAVTAVLEERPDLVLLDVSMPGIDGFGVARLLKADPATATIPIIMISAQTSRQSRVDGLESGAEDFLTKPVDNDELLLKIRNLLRLRKRSAREATRPAA